MSKDVNIWKYASQEIYFLTIEKEGTWRDRDAEKKWEGQRG